MNALIIEDNRALRESLKTCLEMENLEVSAARSWAEAADLAKKERFHFYLIDVFLPGKQGVEILEEISRSGHADFKAVLMSGFFDESAVLSKIPEDLKPRCAFMKKPLDQGKLLKKLAAWQEAMEKRQEAAESESRPGASPLDMSEDIGAFLSRRETFDGQELIKVLFLAHYSDFSGELKLSPKGGSRAEAAFRRGKITKVVSDNKQSYFGALLVEHGLLSDEDLQPILDEKSEGSGWHIGQTLVKRKLLSPHMLNFILKEQIKIRLSQIMSQKSFSVKLVESSLETRQKSLPDEHALFNKEDITDWSADSAKGRLKDSFLESLFLNCRGGSLQKKSPVIAGISGNRDFFLKYNRFFDSIDERASLEEILSRAASARIARKMIYFGVLTRSLRFAPPESLKMAGEGLELFAGRILNESEDAHYKILNIPWESSLEDVERGYRQIVKVIHPDNLPENLDQALRKKCREAFHKASSSYKVISNKDKAREWQKTKENKAFLDVMLVYEKGVKLIKTEQTAEGLKLLRSINRSSHAPSNTELYVIWGEIQSRQLADSPKEAGQIMQRLTACPIDQRVSPLFWFVNGLYYYSTGQYQKALPLFKKAVRAQKDFLEARKRLMLTEKRLRESGAKSKGGLFSSLFQKK